LDGKTMLVALALAALTLLAAQDPIRRAAAPELRGDAPAEDFELADAAGEAFRLSHAWADGWVLLVFVRGMW
jgi:cytochrome oxidase Cu insertion factor (SCO1/SenC/PrrC family)